MAGVSSTTLVVLAQGFRATVNGRVTDASGAAVPNVTVTALNVETNETASATANTEGNYTIPFLKPGSSTQSNFPRQIQLAAKFRF